MPHRSRTSRACPRPRADAGQVAADYVGVVVVVALLVAALAAVGLPARVAGAGDRALCAITGSLGCDGGGGAGGADGRRIADLIAAEEARQGLVHRYGGALSDLHEQGVWARGAGDLDAAEAIAEQFAFYEQLDGSGPRGPDLVRLRAASDEAFADAVDRGTIYLDDGLFNTRYLQTDPVPGDGVLAFDFFIAADNSGPLQGDDRDFADPTTVDPELSRVFLVIDRETGRAQITQAESCTVSAFGRTACNEPRPIALPGEGAWANDSGNDATGEGINFDQTNQYELRADADGVALTYDALNSITPLVISIDGTVRLEPDGQGSYRITEDTRDDYPSRGIYHYRPDGSTVVIDEDEEQGVFCGAMPVDVPGC